MSRREQFQDWLAQNARGEGVSACGIGFPSKTWICACLSPDVPAPAVEAAMRCIADTFEVAGLHHMPALEQRWVFEKQVVFCARRPDKTFLAVFCENQGQTDERYVRRMMEEFKTFQPVERTAEAAPPDPDQTE